MNHNDIIIKPVITEKATALMDNDKYVFRVAIDANKMMIKMAIREIYKVTPEKVNVMMVRGKNRRLRYKTGKRPAWKKAVVTLKPGEKIEIFENR